MRLNIFIEENRDEEIIVYAHKESAFTDKIRKLCCEEDTELIGYNGEIGVRLKAADVCCFVVEDDRCYAICHDARYRVKHRLYKLQEILPDDFVKINQSTLANTKRITRFDASISGTLCVEFENGYRDYVSRRNLKEVKKKLEVF